MSSQNRKQAHHARQKQKSVPKPKPKFSSAPIDFWMNVSPSEAKRLRCLSQPMMSFIDESEIEDTSYSQPCLTRCSTIPEENSSVLSDDAPNPIIPSDGNVLSSTPETAQQAEHTGSDEMQEDGALHVSDTIQNSDEHSSTQSTVLETTNVELHRADNRELELPTQTPAPATALLQRPELSRPEAPMSPFRDSISNLTSQQSTDCSFGDDIVPLQLDQEPSISDQPASDKQSPSVSQDDPSPDHSDSHEQPATWPDTVTDSQLYHSYVDETIHFAPTRHSSARPPARYDYGDHLLNQMMSDVAYINNMLLSAKRKIEATKRAPCVTLSHPNSNKMDEH